MGRPRHQQLWAAGLTFDAGALIAFERGNRAIRVLIERLVERGLSIVVPSCALAQAWRDGSRQARLARLLGSDQVQVEPLTAARARAVGELCGLRGTADITDAFVALMARQHGGRVVTTDPDDLRHLDPSLEIHTL